VCNYDLLNATPLAVTTTCYGELIPLAYCAVVCYQRRMPVMTFTLETYICKLEAIKPDSSDNCELCQRYCEIIFFYKCSKIKAWNAWKYAKEMKKRVVPKFTHWTS